MEENPARLYDVVAPYHQALVACWQSARPHIGDDALLLIDLAHAGTGGDEAIFAYARTDVVRQGVLRHPSGALQVPHDVLERVAEAPGTRASFTRSFWVIAFNVSPSGECGCLRLSVDTGAAWRPN